MGRVVRRRTQATELVGGRRAIRTLRRPRSTVAAPDNRRSARSEWPIMRRRQCSTPSDAGRSPALDRGTWNGVDHDQLVHRHPARPTRNGRRGRRPVRVPRLVGSDPQHGIGSGRRRWLHSNLRSPDVQRLAHRDRLRARSMPSRRIRRVCAGTARVVRRGSRWPTSTMR